MRHATSDIESNSVFTSVWATVLGGLAALAVAMGIGRFAFTPILPMMQEDAGISVVAGGWLASANYFGYLVGALSAIGMRLRPATVIRVGLLIIGFSTLAMGLGLGFFGSMVLRAAAGIASAWVLVFVSAWTLDRLALIGRGNISGVVFAGVGAGIVAAGGVCLLLMSIQARSAHAWISLGGVSLVVSTLIWRFFARGTLTAVAPSGAGSLSGGWSVEFWRLVFCYGAFGFGYIIPATFLPVMAKEVVSDPRLFGWAWPVFGAAAFVSTILAARLKQHLSYRAIWVSGNIVMALGVVVPLMASGLPGMITAALFVGGTFMVITMAAMQEARRVAGPQVRALMAAMTSAFALGQIIGPVSVSFLSGSRSGFPAALIVAAAFLVLSAFALLCSATESSAAAQFRR